MATAAAVVSAIVGVAGAAYSVVEQKKARKAGKNAEKEQRRAERAQQRQAALQNARQRRKAIARQRQVRASAIASAQASGAGGSSSIQGAVGSLDSQLNANLSFQNQLQGHETARFNALTQRNSFLSASNDHLGNSATGQAVSNLPQQLGFGSIGENIGQLIT